MKSLNVLIVEDEILIAELIGTYLTEAGHTVADIAISYDEAVRSFHLQKPDLILLDIRLYGEKSGIEFSKYIGSLDHKVPVVFLSSQYDQRTLSQALETNPYGYLTKPIQKQTLWTTLVTSWKLHESNAYDETEIKVYDGKYNHTIGLHKILYIQAEHIYTNFFLEGGKTITTRKSLKQWSEELPSEIIAQCHRSYLVNKRKVQSVGIDTLIMEDEVKIPMSKNYKSDFV